MLLIAVATWSRYESVLHLQGRQPGRRADWADAPLGPDPSTSGVIQASRWRLVSKGVWWFVSVGREPLPPCIVTRSTPNRDPVAPMSTSRSGDDWWTPCWNAWDSDCASSAVPCAKARPLTAAGTHLAPAQVMLLSAAPRSNPPAVDRPRIEQGRARRPGCQPNSPHLPSRRAWKPLSSRRSDNLVRSARPARSGDRLHFWMWAPVQRVTVEPTSRRSTY